MTDAETIRHHQVQEGSDGADPVKLRFRTPLVSTGIRLPRRRRGQWKVPVPNGSNSTMQIYGPYRVSTTQPNSPAQRAQPLQPADVAPKPTGAPVDQLDLSSGVNRLDATTQVAGSGEIRIDRVADIRRQIADGNYETPEKLDAALDRLLDQFA